MSPVSAMSVGCLCGHRPPSERLGVADAAVVRAHGAGKLDKPIPRKNDDESWSIPRALLKLGVWRPQPVRPKKPWDERWVGRWVQSNIQKDRFEEMLKINGVPWPLRKLASRCRLEPLPRHQSACPGRCAVLPFI